MDDIYALEQMEQIEKQQRRIEELEQIADAYENAIIEHFVREGDLKQLCRDMYPCYVNADCSRCESGSECPEFYEPLPEPVYDRMINLGIIEGSE